jgi:hypothetical protein
MNMRYGFRSILMVCGLVCLGATKVISTQNVTTTSVTPNATKKISSVAPVGRCDNNTAYEQRQACEYTKIK